MKRAGKTAPRPGAPAAAEGANPLLAALLFLLLGGLLWQSRQLARVKVGQHFFVRALGKVLPQGEVPGLVSNPIALEAGPGGTLYTFHRFEGPKAWMIQRLGPDLALQLHRDFPDASRQPLKQVVDLAVDKDGGSHLLSLDGQVTRLDAAFKPLGVLKLEINEAQALEINGEGHYFALEAAGRRIVKLDAQGKLLAETDKKRLISPKRIANFGTELVVLDELKAGYQIKVFSPKLEFLRTVKVFNLPPSPPVRIAAGKDGVLAVNDAHGPHGVQFYDVRRGIFLGETLGVGEEPIIHPGFVAADPLDGSFYLHFGPGLLKCRLPGRIYGES